MDFVRRLLRTPAAHAQQTRIEVQDSLVFLRAAFVNRTDVALGAELRRELGDMRKHAYSLKQNISTLWNDAASRRGVPSLTPEAEHMLAMRIDLPQFVKALGEFCQATDDAHEETTRMESGNAQSRQRLLGKVRKEIVDALNGVFARLYAGADSDRSRCKRDFIDWALPKVVNGSPRV